MTALPLSLARVLEDESARLDGPSPAMPSRWEVRAEEIVNGRELARELMARLGTAGAATYPNVGQWNAAVDYDPAYATLIAPEINLLLRAITANGWLFQDPVFAKEGLARFRTLRPRTSFGDDEVFNLNRQMFDEVFADHIRSAADVRFSEMTKEIHRRAGNGHFRTALSISGGGIRSATFALGVLQGLARRHVLEKFDFISTVSGGGYIGSWLSSWTRRDPFGIRGVAALLAAAPQTRLDPEPAPIRHLRAFSNYLTPRLGLLSADTWTIVATYVRNLLLNWLVLVPLLAGVLALPRFMFSAVVRKPEGSSYFSSLGAMVGAALGVIFLTYGLWRMVKSRPITDRKNLNKFTDPAFIRHCLLPMVAASICFVLAWAWHVRNNGDPISPWWFLGIGLFSCLLSWVAVLIDLRKTSFVEEGVDLSTRHGRGARIWWELGASVVAGIVGGMLVWLLTAKVFATPVTEVRAVSAVRWPVDEPGGFSAITATYVCLAVPLLLAVLFMQAVIFVGGSSRRNHDYDREWWARASGWVLLAGLVWIVFSAITIYGPIGIYHVPKILSAAGGAAGIFSLLAGRSGTTSANPAEEERRGSKLINIALGLAVPFFVIYLLALISLATTLALAPMYINRAKAAEIRSQESLAERAAREYQQSVAGHSVKIRETPLVNTARLRSVEHLRVVEKSDPALMLLFVFAGPFLGWLISLCIGVNVFSLHAMYRNRLVRAYLGASRWRRDPNPFTGFDPRDNLFMHDLRPEYIWWHSLRDFDGSIMRLRAADTPRLQFLLGALHPEAKTVLRNPSAEIGTLRMAMYQGLNALIASNDLVFEHGKGPPASAASRPLRNRRFIEHAFDDRIYPSPMPLFCSQDILQACELRNVFACDDLDSNLGTMNHIVATGDFAALPAAETQMVDASRFTYGGIDPVHPMIMNRLKLDVFFGRAIAPLDFARPIHLVNICLNLTSGEELAWQERKGESFTVSPLHSGSHLLGYRDTRKYAEISLGTAVTISGAAASPNMGYHSSPALAFLMTLFNVRLGWWLGNPGLAGNDTWQHRNPRSSITPLLNEATGNTNDKYEYVYLSDGGHFDNLGIYEMVLRRCHRVVVSDAGADPKFAFDDLGNAIRKIRVDLGIPITLTKMGIIPADQKTPGKYCAIGKIDYACVDGDGAVEGLLLYLKPVVYEDDAPRDVVNYSKQSPDFPHESTADQSFSESQFESYRALGSHAIDEVCGKKKTIDSIDELIRTAQDYIDESGSGGRRPWLTSFLRRRA